MSETSMTEASAPKTATIAILAQDGALLKTFSPSDGKLIEYHPLFGFVSENSGLERRRNRIRHGFTRDVGAHDFKFRFQLQDHEWAPVPVENCEARKGQGFWNLVTDQGTYFIRPIAEKQALPVTTSKETDGSGKILLTAIILFLFCVGALHVLSQMAATADQPQIIEQTTVKIAPVERKVVTVIPESLRTQDVKQQDQIKKAMRQSIGFLGLLGRKDLNKAVGGAPTHLKDASPGAGFGGTQGSGGEELYVGMGQGLQRSTIGNTGVAGLGGIGTKGAGGGQGGYGNSAIGGPGGKSLGSGPLSQDIILEGGLDMAVVQATIAKYLSQVRACYETGLQRNPGLGGFVRVFFEIGGNGNLNFSRVKDSSLGDPEVEGCITQRMMGWKFPNPRGGVNVKVTYPFLLRSARS